MNNLTLRSVIILFFATTLGWSQSDDQRRRITDGYNHDKIDSFYIQIKTKEEARKKRVEEFAKKHQLPLKVYNENGTFREAYGINIDTNSLIYLALDNEDAAQSTRTNYLHPNGGLNLNLEGTGLTIGSWDGGAVLADHQEFSDGLFSYRTTSGDNAVMDGNSFHATHVSGTLIALGVVNEAKGMAPKGENVYYDWNNDISEATLEAQNGLLLSNHSYGTPVFNTNGNLQIPNYAPGKYDPNAQAWDELLYLNPYYLQVVSAGNEGHLNYTGQMASNRDKLVGEKNAKNNLVIANAQDAQISSNGSLSSVAINPSSTQGPTDDKRIKPDITGNGTRVFSSTDAGIDQYITISGTSMSAPNVTGTLLLLQELYNNKNSKFMRSATLKGLVCHTADDAGQLGPDPVFGWGLLNAKKAAETITNASLDTNLIQERSLSSGQTFTMNVEATGTENLRASISWTDEAGAIANNTLNDNTPVLISDLDLRITRGSTEYLPYKLPNNTLNAAVKGDNKVDNIEVVDVDSPTAGEFYTISVAHKGFLLKPQDYSIVITGASSTLSIDDIANNDIAVYPNPISRGNSIKVNLKKLAVEKEISLELFDLLGRKAFTKEISQLNNIIEIPTANLLSGVYILKITTSNNEIQKKVIIK